MLKSLAWFPIASLLIATPSLSFHDGGVAHCNGCHTMHNTQDGTPVDPDHPSGNPWLLVDETPSDVCIACHDHVDQPLGTDPLSPPPEKGAGNFVFLLEDNLNDGHGGAGSPIPGDGAGHNLVAPGHGLSPDATLTTAPGGSFPSAVLGCTSCHDPHGRAEFRLLHGLGSQIQGGITTFTRPAPQAVGISLFAAEGPALHTAYLSGMSRWCGNCHGSFHGQGSAMVHPTNRALGAHIASAYGLYNGTVDVTGGDPTTAYLPEVPFEDSSNDVSSTHGPAASSRISCISCHRAHATSAPDAGRWDFNVTFLDADGIESGSWAIPNPYADANQRSLCNKCHVQDTGDASSQP